MAYTPTTWVTGDTINATAMNKIENGIANAGSALICESTYDAQKGEYTLDKTALEIYQALTSGTPAYIMFVYGGFDDYAGQMYLAPIIGVMNYNYTAIIKFIASKPTRRNFDNDYYNYSAGALVYLATGVNDYPVFDRATTTAVASLEGSGVGGLN